MTNVLKISSHDELISSIPHTLGFTPRGMVCLAFGDGPTARLDIPESPEEMGEFLQALTDVYLYRHHPDRVALVAYGEDGRACVQALAALGEALVNSEVRGPDVGPVLWVNGEEWTDLLEGTRGTVDPGARARIDAEFALLGRVMPVGRREDLAAAMQGDPTAVAEHLPAAEAGALDMDVAARRSEVEWLGARLDQFRRDREYLSDGDAARVLAVLHDSGARDAAVFSMSREDAPVFSEFWQDLVRRAPSEDAGAELVPGGQGSPGVDRPRPALGERPVGGPGGRCPRAGRGPARVGPCGACGRRCSDAAGGIARHDRAGAPCPRPGRPQRPRRQRCRPGVVGPRPLRRTETDPCRTLARDWRSASRSSSPPLPRSLLGTRRDTRRSTWSTSTRRPRTA